MKLGADPRRPWVVAHRGASASRPENTLSAFREALDQMIKTILESADAEIGFITLYDSERDRHLPGGKIILGKRPLSQDDYHQVGDLIRKAKDEHRTIAATRLPGSEIESIMVVPMFITGLFLGAVVLINKNGYPRFSDQDIQMVEAVTRIIDSSRVTVFSMSLKRHSWSSIAALFVLTPCCVMA